MGLLGSGRAVGRPARSVRAERTGPASSRDVLEAPEREFEPSGHTIASLNCDIGLFLAKTKFAFSAFF